jgi:hypothetical protein
LTLRETAIHITGIHRPDLARTLHVRAMRCSSAFDAQVDLAPIDTDGITKINVILQDPQLVPVQPWIGELPQGADRGELTTRAPIDLKALVDVSAEDSIDLMFRPYWSAMIALAQEVGWNPADFEHAGRRAQDGGLLARLHREKRDRTRSRIAIVDGVVQASHIDLTLRILDGRSGDELAKDNRRAFGDYWSMKDAVHKMKWTDEGVEIIPRAGSLVAGRPWVLAA